MGIKAFLKLPVAQQRLIHNIVKEQSKENRNMDLINRYAQECLKTENENFIFVFACYCNIHVYQKMAVKYLLEKDLLKWAIPCSKDVKNHIGGGRYVPFINRNECVDALIKAGDCETLCKYGIMFDHNSKIEDYLIQERKFDLILDYAKKVKRADLEKIGLFIDCYAGTTPFGNQYKYEFNKIYNIRKAALGRDR